MFLMMKLMKIRAVKFDTETLPSILNGLETDNGGQKLVLEVAVSFLYVRYSRHLDVVDG